MMDSLSESLLQNQGGGLTCPSCKGENRTSAITVLAPLPPALSTPHLYLQHPFLSYLLTPFRFLCVFLSVYLWFIWLFSHFLLFSFTFWVFLSLSLLFCCLFSYFVFFSFFLLHFFAFMVFFYLLFLYPVVYLVVSSFFSIFLYFLRLLFHFSLYLFILFGFLGDLVSFPFSFSFSFSIYIFLRFLSWLSFIPSLFYFLLLYLSILTLFYVFPSSSTSSSLFSFISVTFSLSFLIFFTYFYL